MSASTEFLTEPLTAETLYAGLVTRTIAFALDAALVNGVALFVGVTIGLGISILHLPSTVDTILAAILGAAWIVWLVGYFAFFWSSTGQTPGDRVMRIQVVDRHAGGSLRPLRAALRFGGVVLAAIPLFAGILIMLWDERHRCLQDRLARTVVIYVPAPSPTVPPPSPYVPAPSPTVPPPSPASSSISSPSR